MSPETLDFIKDIRRIMIFLRLKQEADNQKGNEIVFEEFGKTFLCKFHFFLDEDSKILIEYILSNKSNFNNPSYL